jgi:Leucine-rich repeat (LRR) protein
LGRNQLTEFPEKFYFPKLRDLVLVDNNLEDLPNTIASITTFQTLHVREIFLAT